MENLIVNLDFRGNFDIQRGVVVVLDEIKVPKFGHKFRKWPPPAPAPFALILGRGQVTPFFHKNPSFKANLQEKCMLNQNMKSVFLYFEFQTFYQAVFDFDHFFINFYIFMIF